MRMKQHWLLTNTLALAAALCVGGCVEDHAAPVDGTVPDELVADGAPLSRITAEQYNNTVRDLFTPVQLPVVVFPVELEGRGGFENNVALNTATPAVVETYQRAASDVASAAAGQLDALLDCDRNQQSCTRDWLVGFAQRAWRRPLTEDEREALVSDYDGWKAQYGIDTAMTLSIQFLLQSPDFLYFPRFGEGAPTGRDDAVALTNWELAARLSYLLWNSMPDAELLELADQGRLQDRDVLAEQAFRMLSDWRAVDMVVSFHRQNWDLDDVGANPIDLDFYAPVFEERGFSAEDDKSDYYYLEYSPRARFESDVFIARHLFHGDGKLETLLTSNKTWVTPEVADMAYEQQVDTNTEPVSWSARIPQEGNDEFGIFDAEYYPIELDPDKRAGLFTMVGFLIAKAGPRQPAPVRRGVTILDRLLCTELLPPGDVPPLEIAEEMEPKTNREKYAIHTQSEACAGCHRSIDGIGLTFENYDAMGRWRDQDNGHNVHATGRLIGTDQDGEVENAVALMKRMGKSRTVHDCYVKQWFRYAFGRNETAEDAPTLAALQEGFWQADGNVLQLIVNLAGSYSFRYRRAQ